MANGTSPANPHLIKSQTLWKQRAELQIQSAAQRLKSEALLRQIVAEKWYRQASQQLHKQSLAELRHLEDELGSLVGNTHTGKGDLTKHVEEATPSRINYDRLPGLFAQLKRALHNYDRAIRAQPTTRDNQGVALVERIVNQAEMLMKHAEQMKNQQHPRQAEVRKLITLVDDLARTSRV